MQHPSPHLASFFGPWVPPPRFTPAPADAATKDRIALLAKYAMQNGAAFIDMVRTKQAGNVDYNFLQPGGQNHDFWRWALYASGYGLSLDQPPVTGPGAAAGTALPGAVGSTAPPAASAPALPADVSSGFTQVLDALTGSKESIKNSQAWFMACASHAPGLAHMMAVRTVAQPDFNKQLHLIYLANDVLFKALNKHQQTLQQQQQQAAEGGGCEGDGAASSPTVTIPPGSEPVAKAFAPVLGAMLAAAQSRANALAAAGDSQAAAAQEGLGKLQKMLTFWSERSIFDADTISRLTQEMQAADPAAVLAAVVQPQQPAAAAAGAVLPPAAGPAGHYPGWGHPAAAAVPGVPPAAPPTAPYPAGAAAAAVPQPFPPAYPGAAASYVQQGYPGAAAPAAGYPPVAYPGGWPQQAPGAPGAWPAAAPGYHPQQPPPPAGWPVPAAPPGAPAAAGAAPTGWPGQYPPTAPYPAAAVAAGYPAAAAGYPGQPPGGVPEPSPAPPVAQRPPSPEAEPVSSFCFPPGLIPKLVRDKQKWADAYTPIELRDIEDAGLPPPPKKDAYLTSRMEKFLTEVHDWRPGSTRAELEEQRAAQRRASGIDANSDDEFSGLGAAALTAGQRAGRRRPRSPRDGDQLGMRSDGSFRGGRGSEHAGLGSMPGASGLGSNGGADPADMYGAYRQKRSGVYHSMILKGVAATTAPR